jgi:O-6-methylguanine DNA methyltransferase
MQSSSSAKKSYLKSRKEHPAFCQKVWEVCLQIPSGETRTYGWIARKLGKPGAARAVGTALGKNPFAPYVPCHRVVRSDGSMGEYNRAGGSKTKWSRLEEEGVDMSKFHL